MPIGKRIGAEFFGAFWLVFMGCGSAALAAAAPDSGLDTVGVALAFGLTLVTLGYALRHVSGAHFNPAVTLGLVISRRFPARDALVYVGAQVLGSVLGAAALYAICSGAAHHAPASGLGANGYAEHSPGHYSMLACMAGEALLTFLFVFVVLGSTDKRAPSALAPLAIGLALTLVHLIGMPATNMSANPARSTGPALMAGGWAIMQLWLFWIGPLVGGALAGVIYPLIAGEPTRPSSEGPTGTATGGAIGHLPGETNGFMDH